VAAQRADIDLTVNTDAPPLSRGRKSARSYPDIASLIRPTLAG
jgi:hypothetical protein